MQAVPVIICTTHHRRVSPANDARPGTCRDQAENYVRVIPRDTHETRGAARSQRTGRDHVEPIPNRYDGRHMSTRSEFTPGDAFRQQQQKCIYRNTETQVRVMKRRVPREYRSAMVIPPSPFARGSPRGTWHPSADSTMPCTYVLIYAPAHFIDMFAIRKTRLYTLGVQTHLQYIPMLSNLIDTLKGVYNDVGAYWRVVEALYPTPATLRSTLTCSIACKFHSTHCSSSVVSMSDARFPTRTQHLRCSSPRLCSAKRPLNATVRGIRY